MVVLNGIPASPGVAIGRAFFINRALPRSVHSTVPKEKAEDEVAAFLRSVARSREQIQTIREGVKDQSTDHYQILSVHLALLEDCEPVLETMPGWASSTEGVRDYASLPSAARDYVERISDLVGADIGIVSTGPERDQTLFRTTSPIAAWFE